MIRLSTIYHTNSGLFFLLTIQFYFLKNVFLENSPQIVYVELESGVNFATVFGDLYQNKRWGICNNLNQFTHLSSATGPNDGVINMTADVLLMHIY